VKKPSIMQRRVQAYLTYRRTLGFALYQQGFILRRFARFAERSGHRGPLTPQIILRWLESSPSNYDASKLSAVRNFAKHLALNDGRSQVPGSHLVAPHPRRKRPHIYTPEQIRQLLEATERFKLQHALAPLSYRTLFGLMAATGLRIGEATGLACGHVDLERGVLRVVRAKFHKSRLVPLHSTVVEVLRRYAAERDKYWEYRAEQHFFRSSWGHPISVESAQDVFCRVRDSLGWQNGNGEMGKPRLHDLRHTFACHRIQQWYQEGRNIHLHIHALATYLGHSDVTSTYWYLTATPELLATAGHRFENFAGRKAL
jgi:integrase